VARDYYGLLGVSKGASDSEIKRAYRKLARELHPDVNPDEAAQAQFREIGVAYEVLSDPEKRRIVDLGGDPMESAGAGGFGNGFGGAGFGGLGDVFEAFFGGGGGGRGPVGRVRPGSDSLLRMRLDLAECATGVTKHVTVDTAILCDLCHLEVVALTPARLLLVVITDSGRVDQRIVELGDAIDDVQLSALRERLGQALEGKPITTASVAVSDLASQLVGHGVLGDAVGRAATVLVETLVEHSEERLLLGGTANLTRNTADFGGSLRSVLEALEEQVVVLRLLAAQEEAGKVTVRIGHETAAEQMAGTSVVSTTYGSSGKVFGGMGVVGPTRMDYPGTISNVAAVALYIGEVLGAR